MRQAKKLTMMAGGIAAAVLLTGCAADARSAEEDESQTVPIALIEALSGDLSGASIPFGAGVQLAVKDINDAGGFEVDGVTYTFDLIEKDTRSTGPDTVAAANEVVLDGDVDFVFGPMSSGLATQAAEITTANDVMHFSAAGAWAQSGALRDSARPYLFGTNQLQAATAETLGEGLKKAGYTTLVMLNTDDAVTEANAPALVQGFKAAGIDVLDDIRYPADAADLSSYVSKAGELDPDVVFHATSPSRTLEVLQLAEDFGIADALAGWTLSPSALKAAGFALPVYSANTGPSMDYPATDRIADLATRMDGFAPDMGATKDFAFWSYDFVYMLVAAMQLADSVSEVPDIAAALQDITYDGVVGKICFGDGEDARVPVYPSYFADVVDGEVGTSIRDRECTKAPKNTVAYFGP